MIMLINNGSHDVRVTVYREIMYDAHVFPSFNADTATIRLVHMPCIYSTSTDIVVNSVIVTKRF